VGVSATGWWSLQLEWLSFLLRNHFLHTHFRRPSFPGVLYQVTDYGVH
jgi:hypothetical protein